MFHPPPPPHIVGSFFFLRPIRITFDFMSCRHRLLTGCMATMVVGFLFSILYWAFVKSQPIPPWWFHMTLYSSCYKTFWLEFRLYSKEKQKKQKNKLLRGWTSPDSFFFLRVFYHFQYRDEEVCRNASCDTTTSFYISQHQQQLASLFEIGIDSARSLSGARLLHFRLTLVPSWTICSFYSRRELYIFSSSTQQVVYEWRQSGRSVKCRLAQSNGNGSLLIFHFIWYSCLSVWY